MALKKNDILINDLKLITLTFLAFSIDVMKNDYGRDIIELLEAVAYLICQDDPITSETFYTIMTSKSVPR